MRGQALTATLLISIAIVMVAVGFGTPRSTEAVVEPVYTLPFYSNYRISCGFGCYSGHAGVDIELNRYGEPGEVIAAAKEGTAKNCGFDLDAGNYVVLDHGNGHRTRYLHMNSYPPVTNGQSIARGEIIGFEGNTGDSTDDHLHFETRIGATTFTCGHDGTAVDPYASSTYMWEDDPPNHADFGPAIASWSSSKVNEFVRGKDNELYQRVNGGSWTKPRPGSCLRSGPAATTLNSTKINVFIRGCDDKLYQLRYTGSWGSWVFVPGGTCVRGAPAATSWSSDRVDVFYRGCNDQLYHGWSVNGGLSWTSNSVGGCLRSGPGAVSWGSGRLDVVYRGCDDAIWHKWQQGGSSWPGNTLGGCTMTAPAIASWGTSKLDVFHRGCGPAGAGEALFLKSQTGGSSWSGSNLGGCLSSAPGADAWAPDKLDALHRGCTSPPNSVWKVSWNGVSWTNTYTGSWP